MLHLRGLTFCVCVCTAWLHADRIRESYLFSVWHKVLRNSKDWRNSKFVCLLTFLVTLSIDVLYILRFFNSFFFRFAAFLRSFRPIPANLSAVSSVPVSAVFSVVDGIHDSVSFFILSIGLYGAVNDVNFRKIQWEKCIYRFQRGFRIYFSLCFCEHKVNEALFLTLRV